MPLQDLLDLAIAASSLVTAVATTLIAWAAHRFSKSQANQTREASLRQSWSDWNDQLNIEIRSEAPSRPALTSTLRKNYAVDKLHAIEVDTKRLDSKLATLRGHAWWIPDASDLDNQWIQGFDGMTNEVDELISAMLNGALDVVKDEVLHFEDGQTDDFQWIRDEFWIEPYFNAHSIDSLETLFRNESRIEKHTIEAVDRWGCGKIPFGASVRITELVRYKLLLELSLRTFFVGTFTNLSIGANSSPSRKFRDGITLTTNKLLSDIDTEFENTLRKLK